MGDSTPTFNSPKRKRDQPPNQSPKYSPMRVNTNLTGAPVSEEDGATGSPRTKVAYHFQGLQLEGGEVVSKFDLRKSRSLKDSGTEDIMKDEDTVRKRMKVLEGRDREIPESPQVFTISIGPERMTDPAIKQKASKVVLHNDVDPVIFKGVVTPLKGSGLARAYPSINRLADSKSRGRKRAGTLPLFGSAEASLEQETTIVDPHRAAMTWHDDEITGQNPDDPDDDGEGINGIGFKPTPAIAYARNEKRRQQIAEYKNREAREARAKRSERRRGSEALAIGSREEVENARRVRFLEAEAKSVLSAL